ncbi:MAG: multiprotein bridging factor aMBF1 [Candidatus Woesearchaeota archaeon]
MQCELCGKGKAEFSALIEGVELKVCNSCLKYGHRLIKPVSSTVNTLRKEEKEIDEEVIVDNFAEIIKKKREELNMTQEEFAKKLNEKISTIQAMESGRIKPTIETAKKLQKILKINLIKKIKTEKIVTKKSETSFTIGDILKTFKKEKG